MHRTIFFIFLLLLTTDLFPQIIFRSLPDYAVTTDNLNYFESSGIRKKIMLNGKWDIYPESDKKRPKTKVDVPSVYEGEEDVIYEKSFSLTKDQVEKNIFDLNLLGASYGVDISLNGSIIYRHSGGAFPVSLQLPPDLLRFNDPNVLLVKIHPSAGERNRIPLSYQLFSPKEYAGIYRDIFINEKPSISFDKLNFETISANESKARIQIKGILQRRNTNRESSSIEGDGFTIETSLVSTDGSTTFSLIDERIEVKKGKEKSFSFFFDVSTPRLWTPENPVGYKLKFRLLKNGEAVDEVTYPIAIIHLSVDKSGLALNGTAFTSEGTAYVPVNKNYGSMFSYEEMQREMKMIKDMGFNTVRFTKCMPHPYLLSVCQEIGLLAIIELPFESLPNSLISDNLYLNEMKNYVTKWESGYANYSVIGAYGLGCGYNCSDEATGFFLTQLTETLRQQTNRLLYANVNPSLFQNEVPGLDFYGLEFITVDLAAVKAGYLDFIKKVSPNRVLILGLSYPVTEGSSSGYTNPGTYEAQGKFYSDFYKFANTSSIPAYFMGYMFDYRMGLPTLIGKYNDQNIFPVGLIDEDRNPVRPVYKSLYALLHNLQAVTIPIGIKKDTSPISFIIFGLVLGMLIGFLFNSSRKFREDAGRALIRSYNFFADVRDARMYTVLPSMILSVLVSGSLSLVISSFLFYFKSSITFEKVLNSLPNENLIAFISYLSWHPIACLLIMIILVWLHLIFITTIIRIAAYMVMNRVSLSSAFYVVSWAHIPVLLLVPFAIVLYRVLQIGSLNIYIYGVWVIFSIWMALRVLKGTHVIFDISPGKLYFITAILGLIFFGGLGYYFQESYFTIDYLLQALRDFKLGA